MLIFLFFTIKYLCKNRIEKASPVVNLSPDISTRVLLKRYKKLKIKINFLSLILFIFNSEIKTLVII